MPKYFYWVSKTGRLWPQAADSHPKLRLEKTLNVVGPVHEITEDDWHLPLSTLIKKYPEPSQ